MDVENNSSIGERLRRIRRSRGKSQAVIAGLAGISTGHLSRLESGERALDRLTLVLALADALEVAPSELTRLPVPAPGDGGTDGAVGAVRLALVAVDLGSPRGQVLPVEALRSRVAWLLAARRRCRFAEVGAALPGLIRDLHTSIAAGRDVGELLPLAVMLHVHVTRMWLDDAGAPKDLRRQVASLARDLAQEHGEVTTLGVAAFGTAYALLAAGMLDLAQGELDAVVLPATTAETVGLVGGLTMTQALVATADERPGAIGAPREAPAELAAQFGEPGESDPLGFGFGPTNVAMRRMELALEAGEPDRAVSVAREVQLRRVPSATRQASSYWMRYGRALAKVRGRQDDAVRALRTAEVLLPVRVQRDPIIREVLAQLLTRSRRDAMGRELRGMAYRAGLPV